MAYKFNPFTGNLDEVGTGGGGGTTPPAGSDTQIQFNDGGAFGGDAGLTYNKTTDELTVAGDINLDDGGAFSTTVQSVTPTANRTISFPDATGTVALVSGANGTIQYNDTGTLKGNSNFTVNVDWDNPATTFTALKVNVPDVLQGAADSSLLDLQAGGTSKFKFISSTNEIALPTAAASSISFRSFSLVASLYNRTVLSCDENGVLSWPQGIGVLGSCILDSGKAIEYNVNKITFNSPVGLAADVQLSAIDVGTLQLDDRSGGPGKFYIVNTYTDANNYERGFFQWNSNVLELGTEAGSGGGSNRSLSFISATGSIGINGPDTTSVNLYNPSQTYLRIRRGTTEDFEVDGSNVTIKSTSGYSWSSTTQAGAAVDTSIARDSAGVVKVTDGSAGTGYLKLIPTTVGALTAAATVGAGTKAFVTDSTSTLSAHHGQAVVGGGNNFVPVFSDGTNWIVG